MRLCQVLRTPLISEFTTKPQKVVLVTGKSAEGKRYEFISDGQMIWVKNNSENLDITKEEEMNLAKDLTLLTV